MINNVHGHLYVIFNAYLVDYVLVKKKKLKILVYE